MLENLSAEIPTIRSVGSQYSAPQAPNHSDRTVEQLQQRLTQMERLAAVGELTSTTTHEFNNLLMTILNYAKMGLRNKDEPSREKAFTRILDAANRGAKITNTVLGLARNRSGDMEPTSTSLLFKTLSFYSNAKCKSTASPSKLNSKKFPM